MKTTEQMSHMGGTIASVDPQQRSLTIESLVINKTFKVRMMRRLLRRRKNRRD